jgi:DNA-binding transcriptional LysR family regulator
MISLEDLRFFAVVARHPTLAAAARSLDVSPSAVTQRLRQLEARLRVRLVDRSTRRLVLTDEGELLAERGIAVLGAADEIAEALATRRGAVTGLLRVVAPFGFGRRYVASAAAEFRRLYPESTIALSLSENPQRLPEGSWDVLVHVGELRDSGLISLRLAPNDRVLCAAPDYLRGHPEPGRPEDLRRHDCAALRENDEDVTLWRFTGPAGELATVRIDPAMASNDGDVIREWALAGLGVIVRSEWDVAEALEQGRLLRLLPEWRLPSADVTVLLGERNQRTARTSRFIEILKARLSPVPWRTPVVARTMA